MEEHEPYSKEEVVRHLRAAADFIEAGHGGVQKYTVMKQDMSHGGQVKIQRAEGGHTLVRGRVTRHIVHLTYLDKRR